MWRKSTTIFIVSRSGWVQIRGEGSSMTSCSSFVGLGWCSGTTKHVLTSMVHIVVIGIYLDSFLFVFCTATLRFGIGLNSFAVCDGAILLCLVAYVTSKVSRPVFNVKEGFTRPHCHVRKYGSSKLIFTGLQMVRNTRCKLPVSVQIVTLHDIAYILIPHRKGCKYCPCGLDSN